MQFLLSLKTPESTCAAGTEVATILRRVADSLEEMFAEVAEEQGDLIVERDGSVVGKWAFSYDEPALEQVAELV